MKESCVFSFLIRLEGKTKQAIAWAVIMDDFGRRHWNSAMLYCIGCWSTWTLEVDVNSWVSLRRICTDELAGSSFRAVRASQESRSVKQRWTWNLDESRFSLVQRKRVKSENPIEVKVLFSWNRSRLIVQSCGEGSDLLGRETNETSKMFWSSRGLRKYTRFLRLHAMHPHHLIQSEQCPAEHNCLAF